VGISTIPKKLKLLLSKNKLNKLGKATGFTKRERNITTFQLVADKVFSYWINNALAYKKGCFSKFKNVYIQDGSSFAVKDDLKNVWPGRFKKISPAAVELHATINLKSGSFEQATITPDTFSERAEMPTLEELKDNLFLADRGYYSGNFIVQLDKALFNIIKTI